MKILFSGGSFTSQPGRFAPPAGIPHATLAVPPPAVQNSSTPGLWISRWAATNADLCVFRAPLPVEWGTSRLTAWCHTQVLPIEQTIGHLGPISHTVSDAALMLNVMAGVDGFDPRQPTILDSVDYVAALGRSVEGLKVGIVSQGFWHSIE